MLDLRHRQSPMKHQGRRATCVSFAATAGHEMLRGENLSLSEEFLHWASKQRDGLGKNIEETYLWAAAEALTALGQPPAEIWPYDEACDQAAPDYGPPDGAIEVARLRRIGPGRAVQPTAAGLRAALDASLAVLLGFKLFKSFFLPDFTGRIDMPTAGEYSPGGHAVLVVGYADGEGQGGGQFVIRNSWGATWGDAGYGLLPYAYVDLHGLDAWGLR